MNKKAILTLFLLFATAWIAFKNMSRAAISAAAPPANSFNYLPALFSPNVDLSITGLEISQAIQRTDNSVPLVANHSTVVRVFAQTVQGLSPGNITVALSATRNAASLGTLSSPAAAVPDLPSRGDLGSTFNFTLPANWLFGNVQLLAIVDSAGVLQESNEGNNAYQATLNFNTVPPLDVKIVPVNYTHQGAANPGFYPAQSVDYISDWIKRAFPVNAVSITFRSPAYSFTGNLDNSSEWGRLLQEVTSLRSSDSAPSSQFYFALVPIRNGSTSWFSRGVAGIGWVGFRVSAGINLGPGDNSGILGGHEIGHNMGRRHAPCGVAGEPFPYPGASIGQYGLDIKGSSIKLLDPAVYVDLMSYCSPEWISDFTYLGLYADQQANGLLASDRIEKRMLIRGAFDADGRASLAPVYTFEQTFVPEAVRSDYRLELRDSDGNVISSQPVPLLEVEEEGFSFRAIHASLALPKVHPTAVRLLHRDAVLAERALGQPLRAPNQALAAVQSADSIRLNWGAADTPATIRYTVDDGRSWITLAMDWLGGSLSIDKSMLPEVQGRFQVILADTASPPALTAELNPP